jgi:diacylglycerol kinase (ATP)
MYLLVVNPTSGGGKGAKVATAVRNELEILKLGYRELVGSSGESAQALLREAIDRGGIDAVIVVGGDGMINHVLQILANTEIPLLPIAAGTGNDFVRTLGIPMGINALKLLSHLPAEAIDLGRVNGRFFANIVSTGFDSLVNERANRMKMKNRIKYNLAMVIELPLFRPKRYQIEIDGKRFYSEAMLIAIGNGQSYGGGMRVCPGANLQDGTLDLMILEPVSKLEFLRVFPKVYKGTHINHPKVKILKGKEISVNATAVAYADGERIGQLPIQVDSLKNSIYTWINNG